MDVFSLVATLELNASNFFSGLSGAAKAMVDFAADAVKTGAEFDYTMAGVRAVMGDFDGDINELIKLADEMGISYVRGANDAETAFDILREKALASSKQTRYTAVETAEALHYMGMAGWEQVEAMQALDAVMQLAAAGNESVGRTSDIVTDALTAFKQPASEAGHLVDVMATAAAKSNTNINMLGESFKYAAPLAGALGYSFEDVGLALGLMANAGVKSGRAGRAMNNMLSRLADAPDKVQNQMLAFGISLSDAEGKMLSLRGVMERLREEMGELAGSGVDTEKFVKTIEKLDEVYPAFGHAMSKQGGEYWKDFLRDLSSGEMTAIEGFAKLSEDLGDAFDEEIQTAFLNSANVLVRNGYEKVLQVANILGGKQALPALLALINASEEEFNALADALDNSAGAGQRMQNTMLDNLTGDLYRFNSAADVARVALSDVLTPTIREFVQYGTKGITDVTEAFQSGGLAALPGAIGDFLAGAKDLIVKHAPEIEAAGTMLASALSAGFQIAMPYLGEIIGSVWAYVKPMMIEGASDLMNGVIDSLLGRFTDPLRGLADNLRGNLFLGGIANFIDMIVGRDGELNRFVNESGAKKSSYTENIRPESNAGRTVSSEDVDSWLAAQEAAQSYNQTVGETPEEVKTTATAITDSALAAINALIEAINSIPTDVSVNVSGNFSGTDGVNNARSMSGGTILRGATMFGWDNDGMPQIGGGEGAEAVVGVNSLDQMIRESVNGAVSSLMNGLGGMISGSQRQPVQLVLDTGVLVAEIAPSLDSEMSRITTWRHGGDR